MRSPNNCYQCRKPWYGSTPTCDACRGVKTTYVHRPPCGFCGNATHSSMDCYQMPRIAKPKKQFYGPPLKHCQVCKGNYLIETKAGSVCSSCRSVVHNPCRNCDSLNTKGTSGDGMQFIECTDCLFIE